jgi:hypothetical protein
VGALQCRKERREREREKGGGSFSPPHLSLSHSLLKNSPLLIYRELLTENVRMTHPRVGIIEREMERERGREIEIEGPFLHTHTLLEIQR